MQDTLPLFERESSEQSVASCTHCGMPLRAIEINVTANTAACGFCQTPYPPNDFLRLDGRSTQPPHGTTIERTATGLGVCCRTSSLLSACFSLLAISIFGIELIPVLGDERLPTLVYAGLGFSFAALVLLMLHSLLVAIAGKVKIVRVEDEGTVFTGAANLGRTQRFRWSAVAAVVERIEPSWSSARKRPRVIELRFCDPSVKAIRFGAELSDERRWFLLAVLREELARTATSATSELSRDSL